MRPAMLYIFHPSLVMVRELDSILAEYAPDIAHENIIIPDLLEKAAEKGITEVLRLRVKNAIEIIPQNPISIVLCSCSTYGGCAEEMAQFTTNPIIRIDRPMAEQAVDIGTRIGVAAALESTLAPTRKLLESIASKNGKKVQIEDLLCADAWELKASGDSTGYMRKIASYLESVARNFDVIVLAQGSMAPSAEHLRHLAVPILSSPHLAIEKVVQMCRAYATK